jgi:hypothetical protein
VTHAAEEIRVRPRDAADLDEWRRMRWLGFTNLGLSRKDL